MGGGGSTYDYGFRIYNPQIAKFLSVDPLSSEYPFYTPYQFSGNKPISNIDLDGREDLYYLISFNEKTGLSQIKLKHQQDGVLCNCWGANLYVSYGGQTYYQSSFPTSRAGQWFFNYLLGTPTLDDALNSFVGHSKTYIDNMFSSKLNVGEMRAASNDKFEKDWNDMIESIAYAKAGQLYNSKFIKRGMEGAKFAQTSVRSDRKFSPDGIKKYSELAGKPINTIDDLSSAIRSKIIAVKDVQVDYVIMNGQAVILNTRTSAALNNAGIPREQWHGVNRTGQIVPGLDKTYDDLAKDQISKNKLDVNNLPNDPPK
jgi:hypothetical protein